jgi:threonine dehydrogenase-like Zn-dependent dehydrogenase
MVQAGKMGADVVLPMQSPDLYHELASALGTEVRERGSRNRVLHHGASVVYDAVGSGATLHHALRWVRPRGSVVVEGITPHPAPFDCTTIWLREVDLVGSHGHGLEQYEGLEMHTFELVLKWIQAGRLIPDLVISHRFPLREYRSAIRAADGKGQSRATKVLLQMGAHA